MYDWIYCLRLYKKYITDINVLQKKWGFIFNNELEYFSKYIIRT